MSEIIADRANFGDLVGFWCWLLVSKFAPYKDEDVIKKKKKKKKSGHVA